MFFKKEKILEFLKGVKITKSRLGIISKDAIIIDLDGYYFNRNDWENKAIEYLEKQGKACKIIGKDETGNLVLLINNRKYLLIYRNNSIENRLLPTPQIVLDPVK